MHGLSAPADEKIPQKGYRLLGSHRLFLFAFYLRQLAALSQRAKLFLLPLVFPEELGIGARPVAKTALALQVWEARLH